MKSQIVVKSKSNYSQIEVKYKSMNSYVVGIDFGATAKGKQMGERADNQAFALQAAFFALH